MRKKARVIQRRRFMIWKVQSVVYNPVDWTTGTRLSSVRIVGNCEGTGRQGRNESPSFPEAHREDGVPSHPLITLYPGATFPTGIVTALTGLQPLFPRDMMDTLFFVPPIAVANTSVHPCCRQRTQGGEYTSGTAASP